MSGYIDHIPPKRMIPDLSTMRPRDSAPKDGQWFIAYTPNSPMCWAPFEMCSWMDFTFDGIRRSYFCEQDTSDEIEFEGWWPLPILTGDPT